MRRTKEIKIGCCGFPLSLTRYAKIFSTVEVQQTFYQPPLPKTLERWRNQVPPEFEFTLKAWQLITHESDSPTYRRLREKLSDKQERDVGAFRLNDAVMDAWRRTRTCAQILRSRRILFQCPARFTPTKENKDNLRSFFQQVRGEAVRPGVANLIFVWEPRGEWRPEEVKELCAELDLVHGVDAFAGPPVTSGEGYFRLHGKTGYRYRYTDSDLEDLHSKATQYSSCLVFFDNVFMLEDARRFLRLISGPSS